MRFSIILPIYNVAPYLEQCVKSLLNQTFADYEMILVDDGSTDESGLICDNFAAEDPCVKVIHKENGGLSDARNAGFLQATGEYIVFIDSDDYIKRSSFLSDLQTQTEKDAPDLVLYGFQKYFEANQTFGTPSFYSADNTRTYNVPEINLKLLKLNQYTATAWTKCIKRSFLVDQGILFEKGLISEDIDWYLHVLSCNPVYRFLPAEYVVYRQRAGSISQVPKLKSLVDNITIIQKWLSVCKTLPDKNLAATMRAVLAYHSANACILYTRLQDPQKKKYLGTLGNLCGLMRQGLDVRSRMVGWVAGILGIRGALFLLSLVDRR